MLTSGPEYEKTGKKLIELLESRGWSIDMMMINPEYRVPKSPSEASKREKNSRTWKGFPVDLAVFDSIRNVGDPAHIVMIAETKKPGVHEGLSQLETYMSLEPTAKIGIWMSGSDMRVLIRNLDGSLNDDQDNVVPYYGDSLTASKDKPLTWNTMVDVDEATSLKDVFSSLLNKVVSQDTKVTRPEERVDNLCNVLLAKIFSDKIAKITPDDPVQFRPYGTVSATGKKVREAFQKLKNTHRDLFAGSSDQINFDDSTLENCVVGLARFRLYGLSGELASAAFQVFREDNLKAGDGQYFTPREVMTNMIRLLEIRPDDIVLDPACGTGGFLFQAYVSLKERYPRMEEKDAISWANRNLYGVDKDRINVKLTKTLMLTIGDGSTNTFHGDSLRTHLWGSEFPLLVTALTEGKFSVIATNPPFGKNLKLSAEDGRKSGYTVSKIDLRDGEGKETSLDEDGKKYMERELGIAFVEQCYKLLSPSGRLGILLPETYFFSPSYIWFQKWIYSHFHLRAVINVPMEAFQGFCRAKTNIYLFEKRNTIVSSMKWVVDGKVLIVNSETCGINKDGKTLNKVDQETGERLEAIDDQLTRDCMMVESGDYLHNRNVVFHPSENIERNYVAVPRYYDSKYDDAISDWLRHKEGFSLKMIDELVKDGEIVIRHGHGSPSLDQRVGDIPYIKVSDLRSGRVNVNPSNLVPAALAVKCWHGDDSGLLAYDLLSPERASKNIGEFCILLPGQEKIVLTKEIIVLRSLNRSFSQFYLMWALSLQEVREQWRRITFMQTNRDDIGERYLDIKIPFPLCPEKEQVITKVYSDYFNALQTIQAIFDVASNSFFNN